MKEKKDRKNKIIKRLIIAIILIFTVYVVALYTTNEELRSYINKNILHNELQENNVKSIEINAQKNPKIMAFGRYVCVFSKNELELYDSIGNLSKTLNIDISNPIFATQEEYLLIAENEGKTVYLIKDSMVVWKDELDGNILKVSINENGYASIIVKNNTYKSIIYAYKPDGTQLFKKFLSTTLAIVTDISKDNKNLIIGEIDYSGVSVKSNIEVVSIEKAIKEPENSTEKVYTAEDGKILVDLKYTENSKIIAMYDDNIIRYYGDEEKEIYNIKNDDIFVDIGLKNHMATFSKESSGLFSFAYKVVLKNEENEKETIYALNSSIPKEVITNKNVIGMNFGTEVKIINSSGWLLKKYNSSKQIKGLVIGTNIAGIIYKDKIEVINF